MIEFNTYEDLDLDKDPIIFLPCGHFFSVSTLDGVIELQVSAELFSEYGTYTDTISIHCNDQTDICFH